MAWLKSHKELERHPKVLHLEQLCGLDRNGTIGVLHRFWYWTMDYAEDGNLSKWPVEVISKALGIDANHLITSGWIDTIPHVKVHDWEDYFGEYLRSKYRQSPDKFLAIKRYWHGINTVPYRATTGQDKIRGDKIRKEKTTTIADKTPQTTLPMDNSVDNFKEPKPLTDLQRVVTVYKLVSGYPKEDKAWDKLNFARCSKSAKALLEFLGNWKDAGDCIQDVYEKLTSKGLTVTLETVIKHASQWRLENAEKMENSKRENSTIC